MNAAVEWFSAGEAVLIGDSDQSPAYVAMVAENMTTARLEHIHALSRGTVILGLAAEIVDRLGLRHSGPPSLRRGALASVDAARVVGDGSSLADRALTMRTVSDPRSRPSDLLSPGHVRPLAVSPDELLVRASPAGAALELASIAGRQRSTALSVVVGQSGRPLTLAGARRRRDLARLPHVSPAELQLRQRARLTADASVVCTLPTPGGTFQLLAHVDEPGAGSTLALAYGDIGAVRPAPCVHVHHACMLGDTFGSLRCDCRRDLDGSVEAIMRHGAGVLVYVKPAVATLDCGRAGSVDPVRVAALLHAVGIRTARLESNVPELGSALRRLGVVLTGTSLPRAA